MSFRPSALHPIRRAIRRAAFLCLPIALSLSFDAWAAADGKLGPLIAANATPLSTGAEQLLDTCPAIAKWRFRANTAGHNLDGFASRCPQSALVLQPTFESFGARRLDEDPAQAALQAWSEAATFQTLLSTRDDRLWLEGPDATSLPSWRETGAPSWLSTFWSALASMARESGVGLLVHLDGLTPEGDLDSLVTALESTGCRYGFTRSLSIDTLCVGATHPALDFESLLPRLPAERPVVLSHVEHAHLPATGLNDCASDDYVTWLTWFDARLRQTPRVLGAALHDFGSASASALDALDACVSAIVTAPVPPSDFALPDCADESGEGSGGESSDNESPDAPPNTGSSMGASGTFRDTEDSGCGVPGSSAPLHPLFALAAILGLCRRGGQCARR